MSILNFDLTEQKNIKKVASQKKGKSTLSSQQKLPLNDINGPFLRCSDGGTCVYITYPGRNLSLLTEDQRQDYALLNSQPLSALSCDVAGIWVLPERVSSESNLKLCNDAIDRFSEKLFRENTDAHKRCLKLLEEHMRPDFAKDAISTDNIDWRCYLGMKYYHASDNDILIATESIMALIAEKVKKQTHLLSGPYEILDFIDLYIKGWVVEERFIGDKIILPDIR